MALVVRTDFHWPGGKRVNVNSFVASLLQAVGHRAAFQPPFAQKGLAALVHLSLRIGVSR